MNQVQLVDYLMRTNDFSNLTVPIMLNQMRVGVAHFLCCRTKREAFEVTLFLHNLNTVFQNKASSKIDAIGLNGYQLQSKLSR